MSFKTVNHKHPEGGYCSKIWQHITNIKRKPHEIPFESNGRAFRTCEPVTPTDSIIYKGGNNE